jgi:hypothetical protein
MISLVPFQAQVGEGRVVEGGSHSGHSPPSASTALNREGDLLEEFCDGPCRDRTCDLGIKSPLLYQLS